MTFLLADGNLPFSLALGLMLAIALLEGVGLLLGLGLSSFVDSLLPDLDLDLDADVDVDADLDVDAAGDAAAGGTEFPSVFSRLLGWLTVGKVPVLVLLVAFLTVFGLAGLIIQSACARVFGAPMPALVASVPAFLIALPSVRLFGRTVGALIPKEESSAVSSRALIGRVAVITLGTARQGQAAEAKLRDEHGQTHYVRVEPDVADETFEQGAAVLLVNQQGPVYRAIRNPSAALADD